jgi:prephenate dehydrogenase
MTSQQFADSLTKTGLESILRHNTKLLEQLEQLDKQFGEQAKEARDNARINLVEKIKNIKEAIVIKGQIT